MTHYMNLHQQKRNFCLPKVPFLLSKPKAWYGITLWRVWNCRRRMASPMVHFLRLDSIQRFALIPYCLLTDSIHGFAVIKLGLNLGSVWALSGAPEKDSGLDTILSLFQLNPPFQVG